ncbi:MAG TPA: histidine phosphatase family protein [Jiangellaceae bacterium]|nr:histidine phosphatase family protein [Jiangellaceae bacterium]
MSRTLVLVRHAKTASDPPGGVGGDHARALTDRGHRDAAAAAAWLANNDVNVDAALISTARRTVQTAELLGRAIPIEGAELADDVYAAAAGSLLERIRTIPAAAQTLLLVGHAPGIGDLAALLDDGSAGAAVSERLRGGLSTSGVVIFNVRDEWQLLNPGKASVADLTTGRG